MVGHKIGFYGEIWLILVKLSLLHLNLEHCAPMQSGQNLHCLSYGILWLGKHHGIPAIRQALPPFSITYNV